MDDIFANVVNFFHFSSLVIMCGKSGKMCVSSLHGPYLRAGKGVSG